MFIDLSSFSSIWFWIFLVVFWGWATHWILGVPYDMIYRARRDGGVAQQELELLIALKLRRSLYGTYSEGLWIVGILCFVLTILAVLGFAYRVELAQALFLIALPLVIIWSLNLSLARLLRDEETEGAALCLRLSRHRRILQALGGISLFVTVLWGG